MPNKSDRRKAQSEIDLDTYLQVKSRLASDNWSISDLIREAFRLYLAGEIVKAEEPQTSRDGG